MDKTKENTMKIRLATQEDIPEITALCEKHGHAAPVLRLCFVLEDKGKVVGIANGGLVNIIDTIVGDTTLELVSVFSALEGTMIAGSPVPILISGLSPVAARLMASRVGYEKFNSDQIYIKKG